jgi:hypothetical protein
LGEGDHRRVWYQYMETRSDPAGYTPEQLREATEECVTQTPSSSRGLLLAPVGEQRRGD